MRIVAIRGQNLASLAGEFEVALDRSPIAEAGLFAIVGPTGAGKTTILDAMCLALFDKTPRLDERGGPKIGRPSDDAHTRLTSNDVRGILRRGTGAGYAEVDFVGCDGVPYRARWSVRRARDRPNGAFQGQTMTLRRLDTDIVVGDTKQDVKREIVERIGLTFEQFRRSVLLAQGEFATFLRAQGSERADLLERMTGTEIYGRISIEAFERAKATEAALVRLAGDLSATVVLGPEDRAARVALLADLISRAEATAARRDQLAASKRWFEALANLVASERAAKESEREAREADEAATPEADELARAEAAKPLRPLFAQLDVATRDEDVAKTALSRAVLAALACRASAHEATTELGRARDDLATAERNERAMGAAITDATVLDAAIAATLALVQKTDAYESHATAVALAAESECRALEDGARAAESTESRAASDLHARRAHAKLANEWPRWQAAIGRFSRAARASASSDLERLRTVEATATAGREVLVARVAASERQLEIHERDAARAEEAQAELAPVALRGERNDLERRRTILEALRNAVLLLLRTTADASHARAAEAAARARADQALADAREASHAKQELRERLAVAQRDLATARAVLDLTGRRRELHDGEECPLCGSEEHPWREKAPPFRRRVTAGELHVGELEQEQSKLEKLEARHESTEAHAREVATAEMERALGHEARRDTELLKFRAFHGELRDAQVGPDPTADGVVGVIEERLAEVNAQLARVDERLVDEARRSATADLARRVRDAQRSEHDQARRELESKLQELGKLTSDRLLSEHARSESEAAMGTAIEELSAAFDGDGSWRVTLGRDPAKFERACGLDVDAYRTTEELRERARSEIAILRPRLEGARATAIERRSTLAATSSEATLLREDLRSKRSARTALLGGRPTAEVKAELSDRAERARTAVSTTTAARDARTADATHADAYRDECARGAATATSAASGARDRLNAALASSGLSAKAAQTILAHADEWIDARRAHLASLRERVAYTVAIVGERHAQRVAHEAMARPDISEDALPAEQSAVLLELARLHQERGVLEREIRDDDDSRDRRARAEIELQRLDVAARVWSGMRDLIGSADGKKFRLFAQNLTFHALLEQANVHLHELSRRYSLAAVADAQLELQVVDHEMADEVRSSNSLSGGEGFLVSLSLALGLSTIGSQRTRIESLFIDEGFSSLDRQTLDVVVATLEALHASGRQVGVISHVGRLTDKLGARVRLERAGFGRSAVHVERM